jgi:hypothetical protein
MRRHTGVFSENTAVPDSSGTDQADGISSHEGAHSIEIRSLSHSLRSGNSAGDPHHPPPGEGTRSGPISGPVLQQRLTACQIVRMILGFIFGIILVAFIWQTFTAPTPSPGQSIVESQPSSAKHCVTLRGPGKGQAENLIDREANELATTLRHREEYLNLLKKQNLELAILLRTKNETLDQLRTQTTEQRQLNAPIVPPAASTDKTRGEAILTLAASSGSGVDGFQVTPSPTPSMVFNASAPVEAPIALSENLALVSNQSRRSLLWQCPRLYDFTAEEDALVKSLVEHGALVRKFTAGRSTANCTAAPVQPTMRSLVEGRYVPAMETLDRTIGKAELEIVRNVSDDMCPPSTKGKKPSEVHLCAVVRNRAKLVTQWIQYHRMLGIRTFHIFDDSSTDETLQALQPFVEAGIVEPGQLPPPPYQFLGRELPGKQFAAFEICLERGRNKMQAHHPLKVWMAFFDTDEFLLTDKCATDLIRDVEATARARSGNRRPVGAVVVGWSLVPHLPTNWVDKSPTIFDSTNFKFGDLNYHFKSISRSDVVVPFSSVPVSPHGFQLNPPYFSYYEDGESSGNILSSEPEMHYSPGRAVLLHYHTRSLASKLQRAIDGRAGHVHRPSETRTLQNHVDDWLLRSGGDGSFVDIPLSPIFRRRYLTLLRGLGYATTDSAMATMLTKIQGNQNASAPVSTTHQPLPVELREELMPLYQGGSIAGGRQGKEGRVAEPATHANGTEEDRLLLRSSFEEWEQDLLLALRQVGHGLWENLLRPVPFTHVPQAGGREKPRGAGGRPVAAVHSRGVPPSNVEVEKTSDAKMQQGPNVVAPTAALLHQLLQEHVAPHFQSSAAFDSVSERLHHTISERFVARMRQCRRTLQHKSWGQENELEEWREMMRREGNGPYAFGY